MDNIIIIKDFCENALSVDNGEIIKEKINNLLDTNKKVVLDFTGISLFATPFFNACIGYFIIKLSPEKFNDNINCINLSELGQETYQFSYDNAVVVYKRKISDEEKENISKIIEKNIKNS